MRDDKENLIVKLTFEFALDIIEFSEELEANRKFAIAKQIIRSGTSIGANVREAQNAESKNDFIHKFKIAAKEADETEYFLLLCQFSKGYPFSMSLIEKLKVINKIVSKIIASAKNG
ncbi:four helix bundle protein [Mucilaginibacter ginsenosidivorax]|uniref:Four helix bundle protein n=1 Tax=Mucilaginibacter ginsenosidivorax TaxID=862126 RepID=A0A5B8VXX7_9SPHI|nr:four helix bundle protein [Mucilaginibacter ginsenosidivorax]QEC75138.1 four helix bundle protein [Mucilaginibacter ginsenosidivorax]